MICDDVQRLLHEELDPGRPGPALQAHLETCVECRVVRDKLLVMREAMQHLSPPALPDSFELSLRRSIKREAATLDGAKRRAGRRWSPAMISAAAALLLAASGVLLWLAVRPPQSDAVVVQYALRLSVETTHDHPTARFHVELPRGVRLTPGLRGAVGAGGALRWRSHLRSGVNTIELPLVAPRPGGRVRVRLTTAGRTVQRGVELARGPGRLSTVVVRRLRGAPLTGLVALGAALASTPAHASEALELGLSVRRVGAAEGRDVVARLQAALVSPAAVERLAVIEPSLQAAPQQEVSERELPQPQPAANVSASRDDGQKRKVTRRSRHKKRRKAAPASKQAPATAVRPIDISRRLLEEANRLSKSVPQSKRGAGPHVGSTSPTRGKTRLHARPGSPRGTGGAGGGTKAGWGSGRGAGSGGGGKGAVGGAGGKPGTGAGGKPGTGAGSSGSARPGSGPGSPGSGAGVGSGASKTGAGPGKTGGGQQRRGR